MTQSRAVQKTHKLGAIAGSLLQIGAAITLVIALISMLLGATIPDDSVPQSIKPAIAIVKTTLKNISPEYVVIALLLLLSLGYIGSQSSFKRKSKLNRRRAAAIAAACREFAKLSTKAHVELSHRSRQIGDATNNPPQDKFNSTALYIRICNIIAQAFEEITEEKCHCVIKVFTADTDKISTLARDELLHNRDREKVAGSRSREYSFQSDAGFVHIITSETEEYFICNDLAASAKDSAYYNGTPDWQKKFNSTIIIPITDAQGGRHINRNSCVGFVCVDSKKAKFPEKMSVEFLGFFALHLFTFFYILKTN